MKDWKNGRFVSYLLRVADDYEDSGSEATAEDYREAARRIDLADRLKDAGYAAGYEAGKVRGYLAGSKEKAQAAFADGLDAATTKTEMRK